MRGTTRVTPLDLRAEHRYKQDDAHLALSKECTGTKLRACRCPQCEDVRALMAKVDDAIVAGGGCKPGRPRKVR